jgi:hypothetical protein
MIDKYRRYGPDDIVVKWFDDGDEEHGTSYIRPYTLDPSSGYYVRLQEQYG